MMFFRTIFHVIPALLFVFSITSVQAQLTSPKPSPKGVVEQRVGLSDVTISYSRPGVKGREIFGQLVPYGKVWRTGANDMTTISVSDSFEVGGTWLDAGTYGLLTIPGKDEWTIIFSQKTGLWGSNGYDETDDAVRFTVKPETINRKVETMTFLFSDVELSETDVQLMWENTLISFPLKVELESKMDKQIEKAFAPETTANMYFEAARYYYDAEKDTKQALEWVNKAVEVRTDAYWMMQLKAKLHERNGDKKSAIAAAKAAEKAAKERGSDGFAKSMQQYIKELKKS